MTPRARAVLVEMAEREIAPVHGLHAVVRRLAAVDGRFGLVGPGHVTGQARSAGEELLRIAQVVGIVDDDEVAVIAHGHALQRLVDRVADAARLEAVVGGDRRPLELAGDAAVRQIEAHRQFGIPLVDAVAEPHPAAEGVHRVEGVGVDAFVEVRRGVRHVVELVLRPHDVFVAHPSASCGSSSTTTTFMRPRWIG
jgi:hypothetical protein